MIPCQHLQKLSTTEIKTHPAIVAKIMVVDENPLSLLHAVELLQYQGHEVIEVDDSTKAMQTALQQQPDVIIAEESMRGKDGLQLARNLKSDPNTRYIPLIITCLEENPHLRQKALKIGVEEIIVKPLDGISLYPKLKNLIQQKRLQDTLNQTQKVLLTLALMNEVRSGYDTDSCLQLANLARGFGEYLQLSETDIEDLVYAAYLHDIGTLTIPDHILLKSEPLTAAEREIIHQHVIVGENICKSLSHRPKLLEIIRHHHERWDGSGYPDKLVGDEIPYLAQVFQMVDIYYALTHKRRYKPAYTPATSLAIMAEEVKRGWRNPQLWQKFYDFITRHFPPEKESDS
ncbi:MAG: HD domain-containing protein [Geminocystis sp.]|nr:HD domain-containing protein [Geminocystis sp.]HIK37112.1 HD domain-containing protein [Geminocystis sp. M7585_C2015_104]MCS7147519.1 HD domain-containing protein [Geminocystis sp.]MCX8077922.1 HD domain-containing protein [Geminocystis sp.]MDW8115212.1 HD domain-containing phosphohydrolase [Geminocystis sp.]